MNLRNLIAHAIVVATLFISISAQAASEKFVRHHPRVDYGGTGEPYNFEVPPVPQNGDRLIVEGPISFYENNPDKFMIYTNDSSDAESGWSYEIEVGHFSQYLVSGGFLAAGQNEGINTVGFTASHGDWFFGTWLAQSEDDPGDDETYANEWDWYAGWAHTFGEKFTFSATLSYYDLAIPRFFNAKGDLVVVELEASWPLGDVTPYLKATRYDEIDGDVGDGDVFRAGFRGKWGGDEAWWDVDLSLARNDGSVITGTYLWAEIAPGFRIGKHTTVHMPELQAIWGNKDDHLAIGLSITHEFN